MEVILILFVYLLYFAVIFSIATVATFIQGASLGLVPLICGISNGKKGLGWGGFLACIGANFVLGNIPAMAACALFTIFALKKD